MPTPTASCELSWSDKSAKMYVLQVMLLLTAICSLCKTVQNGFRLTSVKHKSQSALSCKKQQLPVSYPAAGFLLCGKGTSKWRQLGCLRGKSPMVANLCLGKAVCVCACLVLTILFLQGTQVEVPALGAQVSLQRVSCWRSPDLVRLRTWPQVGHILASPSFRISYRS